MKLNYRIEGIFQKMVHKPDSIKFLQRDDEKNNDLYVIIRLSNYYKWNVRQSIGTG